MLNDLPSYEMNLESGVSKHSEGTSTLIKTDNILSVLDSILDILQTDTYSLEIMCKAMESIINDLVKD